ncbi:MAG TPA: serine dehydratase beta chain, partial [Roseiarcus sp.]|nr:serine dehydratase beta chain [Roseiarcus sp.]
MVSVFDLFKIGVGPSSSHTAGPMVAAGRCRAGLPPAARRVTAELFGSLAWTGKGHGSDQAVCLGLMGAEPATLDLDEAPRIVARLAQEKSFLSEAGELVAFDPETDLVFDYRTLMPMHSNAMRFRAFDASGACLSEQVFYSIGGGFVVAEGEEREAAPKDGAYPFTSGAELLALCARETCSIADIQMRNECALAPRDEVEKGLDAIIETMFACIDRGLKAEGALPGRLRVRRRARSIFEKLKADRRNNDRAPHEIMDWVSVYAIAVNEENAAGGRVVTAPTNGAAGILPAVLR